MGLTVTATFENQGVYFGGDVLECHIRFSNEQEGGRIADGSTLRRTENTRRWSTYNTGGARTCAPTREAFTAPSTRRPTSAYVTRTAATTPTGLPAFPTLSEETGIDSRRSSVVGEAVAGSVRTSQYGHSRRNSPLQRGERARIESIGGETGAFPRLSTSSVLSTPSLRLGSWLTPFGAGRARHGTDASEEGGLLGSIWRNLGGSRAEPDGGTERLAIGFVEAAGTLVLSTPFIKDEKLEQLAHQTVECSADGTARRAAMGGGMGGWQAGVMGRGGQRGFPVLVSSPTVLFSELVLVPGEAQTFSLRIQLPPLLPPSHRGRTARIAYDLVVVAKRSMLDPSAYVVRIPFRVLAVPGDAQALFALDKPVRIPPSASRIVYQDTTTTRNNSPGTMESSPHFSDASLFVNCDRSVPHSDSISPHNAESNSEITTTDDLYLKLSQSSLLSSVLAEDSQQKQSQIPQPNQSQVPQTKQSQMQGSAKAAATIQAMCARRAPVSFTLSQTSTTQPIASVWLPKRTYQIGDMVSGRIELNTETSKVRVCQVSIWLESTESITAALAAHAPKRTEGLTRKIYSEHHEFCAYSRAIGFALPSPSLAWPSLQSSVVSHAWLLRVELITAPAPSLTLRIAAEVAFPPNQNQNQNQTTSPSIPSRPQLPSPSSSPRSHSPPTTRRHKPKSPVVTQTPPTPPYHSNTPSRSAIAEHQHYHRTSRYKRTMRRKFCPPDQIHVQTLECSVEIHMLPSPSITRAAHRDEYTIELSKRN